VGGYGWGQTTLDGPSGVATDGLSVLVSDRENHRIQRFDRNLNYVATLATRDTAVAQVRFGFPEGLAVSRQGDLYVLDGEGLRVVKFDVGGLFERSFGQSERSAVKLTAPLDIVVTPGERVFVLEPNRVVEYDAFGNVMRTIGEGVIRRGVGMDATDDALAVVTNDTLYWFDASGRLLWSLARNDVMSSCRLDALRDVALAGNKVFLLASWGVVVLRRG
jgi:sugar lactone lactonase YvrE